MQAKEAVEPVLGLCLPAGQKEHWESSSTSLYLPLGQAAYERES